MEVTDQSAYPLLPHLLTFQHAAVLQGALPMRELVELMVKSLVDDPDQARVNEVAGEIVVVYEVSVAEEDLGKVIGKGGRTANAMRTIVKSAASKTDKKATVEILS